MNSKIQLENKLFSLYCIAFLALIYISGAVTAMFGKIGKISFFEIGNLTIPSLLLFVVICFLAAWKRKYYFVFLIFIILAFPAPIDDLFPSVYITAADDRTQVAFPMFTRIDIYLILGITLKLLKNELKFTAIKFTLTLKFFFLLNVVVFIFNTIKSLDLWDFNLLLAYSFHIRYFILFLVLLQLYDIKKYQKELVLSFAISILFLFVEAYINTYFKGAPRLLSGSLSLNTFANISAAIGLFMIFLVKNKKVNKKLAIGTLLVCILIMIGSGTRGAFATLILAYFSLYLLANPKSLVINVLKIFGGVFILGFLYLFASRKEYIPQRYSFEEISKKIEIDFSKEGLNEIIAIKSSSETNSIKSRIYLFDSSLNMISDNPMTGIGAGRWNRYKNEYSEGRRIPKVLLDSHNDYLALMSQYGIPLGLLFVYLIFIYPFFLFRKIKKWYNGPLSYFFVISFAMGIAAMSNSGFFKHQVAALLLFCVCVMTQLQFKNNDD